MRKTEAQAYNKELIDAINLLGERDKQITALRKVLFAIVKSHGPSGLLLDDRELANCAYDDQLIVTHSDRTRTTQYRVVENHGKRKD